MLTLFKPSCVNAKRVLKPINILPISLIRFSMQRIPHGVQPVCFPTFIGQLHSLCIFKIFQRGFFCSSITQAGNLVAHSSFGGGIAWGWRGKGFAVWGVARSAPSPAGNLCSSFAFTIGAQLLYLGAALRCELRWAHVNVLSDATQEY